MHKDGTIIEKIKFPSPNAKVKVFLITYISNGKRLKGFLAEPIANGLFPALLYCRGGAGNVGKVRLSRITQFACNGIIVFAPFQRGNGGSEGHEDFCGEDTKDLFDAFKILNSHLKVLKNSIHVFGFSKGGATALFCGIKIPELASVITWSGVSNMFYTYEERNDLRRMLKRLIRGTPSKNKVAYIRRSPIFFVDKINCPVLIIHGTADQNVQIRHALELESELKSAGKRVETLYFEGLTHYFPPKTNQEIVKHICNWVKQIEPDF
jgi:dipeptidyl aminopeptidase/acylaminoacyl peptidase